jgi:hypothetical protein
MNTDTTEQIELLRDEANTVGDHLMAAICTEALDGDEEAIRECMTVIKDCAATTQEPKQ